MVAIIKSSYSLHRILNYNENKVKEGVAEFIGEENYPMDKDRLTFDIKLEYLLRQLQLNENVKANSIHISLNFDPSETGFDNGRMMEIANAYMEKIGFGNQPYLVYRHYDAGHPHIHLVSIKVRADSSRIDMHNIGRNQSETARKEIEKEFGLVQAEGRVPKQEYELQPITMGRVSYGKLQSKKAVTNILNGILPHYRFTSLPELNAVLKQYNVLADRGSENSRVFKSSGLVYRILDNEGRPIGVPIKASDFYNRPTLKFLEEKFAVNEQLRIPFKGRIKNAVDMALVNGKISIERLVDDLKKKGIHVVLRKSDIGQIYGITYIDNQNKCVFNGSALGKLYSAKSIQERFAPEQHLAPHAAHAGMGLQPPIELRAAETNDTGKIYSRIPAVNTALRFLEAIMEHEIVSDYVPNELNGKKKRKRKNLNNKK